ncbi:hydrolase, alpha/beta fold family [gamma proteobacterium HTCC5015]|nr:hydrolase, alpha/beta fold family [gamma proteobacterium HTCC5015]
MHEINSWHEDGAGHTILGHNIFVREQGKGTPLLLLHGFPSCSWDWHKIAPKLEKEFRLIMPDFLGMGFSDKPRSHDYTIFEQTDIIEHLMDELGIRECSVLAHDYGDSVLQELLARQQEARLGFRIQRALMLNGGLFPEAHNPLPTQRWLAGPLGGVIGVYLQKAHLAKAMQAIAGVENPPDANTIESWWASIQHNKGKRVMHRIAGYMAERETQQQRWSDALAHANIPLAMINGTLDPISGSEMVKVYERVVPNPRIVRLPTVGHYPQIEAPDAVAKLASQFFSNKKQRMPSSATHRRSA